MATQAGDLRERIGFFAPVEFEDGYGNTTTGFDVAPDFAVSAAVKPRLGGEAVLAGRLTGKHYVNITVRASSLTRSVTEAWMARDERSGVAYNIRSIIDPEKASSRHDRFIEMLCEQGVAIGAMALVGQLDFQYPSASQYIPLLEDI